MYPLTKRHILQKRGRKNMHDEKSKRCFAMNTTKVQVALISNFIAPFMRWNWFDSLHIFFLLSLLISFFGSLFHIHFIEVFQLNLSEYFLLFFRTNKKFDRQNSSTFCEWFQFLCHSQFFIIKNMHGIQVSVESMLFIFLIEIDFYWLFINHSKYVITEKK